MVKIARDTLCIVGIILAAAAAAYVLPAVGTRAITFFVLFAIGIIIYAEKIIMYRAGKKC